MLSLLKNHQCLTDSALNAAYVIRGLVEAVLARGRWADAVRLATENDSRVGPGGNQVNDMTDLSVLGTIVKRLGVRVQFIKPRFSPMALENYNFDRLDWILGKTRREK